MNASARLELPSWTGTTHQPQISSTPPHAFRALWFVCKPRATPAGHKKAKKAPLDASKQRPYSENGENGRRPVCERSATYTLKIDGNSNRN